MDNAILSLNIESYILPCIEIMQPNAIISIVHWILELTKHMMLLESSVQYE